MTTRGSLPALVVYAVLLSVAAPMALRRAAWVTRAPRLAIRVWLALAVSWLAAVTLVGLTLAVSVLAAPTPAGFVRIAVVAVGAALAFGVVARAGYVLARELIIARRTRSQHAERLGCASRALPDTDALAIEHPTPAVYCLPSRRRGRQIVVTSAALEALNESELRAVLSHERAHLRCRDHVITAAAASLRLAFPRVPLFRDAREEIAILVEMAADDVATRDHGAHTIAAALATLARAQHPSLALGAGGHTVTDRVRRLLAPPPPLRRAAKLTGAAVSIGAVTLPVALSCVTVTLVAGAVISTLAG